MQERILLKQNPAFREPFKHRRCLIVVDGFYEWCSSKEPFYIQMVNHTPFALAGLWLQWINQDVNPIDSYTIITTEANLLLASVHNRMPVIIDSQHYDLWLKLNPISDELKQIKELLFMHSEIQLMEMYPVTSKNK